MRDPGSIPGGSTILSTVETVIFTDSSTNHLEQDKNTSDNIREYILHNVVDLPYLTFIMISKHPLPVWIKVYDSEKDTIEVTFVNDSYTREFGKPDSYYIYDPSKNIIPEKTSEHFEADDRIVLKGRGIPIHITEKIYNSHKGCYQKLDGYKWGPVHVGKLRVPIYGIITKIEEYDNDY